MSGDLKRDPGSNIPVFNLDENPGVREIVRACDSFGCFNITSTGTGSTVTRSLLDCMEEFFQLADDHPVKQEVHRDRNEGANGWTPMLEEPAYVPGTIAWVESFDCVLSRQKLAKASLGIRDTIRPMRWPAIDDFRESARAQWAELEAIAEKLYPLISAVLEQDTSFLAERASTQLLNTLRLLNYPARPLLADDVSTGISAHTDFECITLIQQTAPGLEIRTPRGEWIQVPVEPGQWTVLLGDVIERWSNGRLRATPHRVPVTPWARNSIVMFFAIDPGLEIHPLVAFVDENHPPAFAATTQGELINCAMKQAEANRQAMAPQAEKLRSALSRD